MLFLRSEKKIVIEKCFMFFYISFMFLQFFKFGIPMHFQPLILVHKMCITIFFLSPLSQFFVQMIKKEAEQSLTVQPQIKVFKI